VSPRILLEYSTGSRHDCLPGSGAVDELDVDCTEVCDGKDDGRGGRFDTGECAAIEIPGQRGVRGARCECWSWQSGRDSDIGSADRDAEVFQEGCVRLYRGVACDGAESVVCDQCESETSLIERGLPGSSFNKCVKRDADWDKWPDGRNIFGASVNCDAECRAAGRGAGMCSQRPIAVAPGSAGACICERPGL
jgi:hypothetical protein